MRTPSLREGVDILMCHKGGTNHETYNKYIIFLLYVGYMLISWPNMQEINKLKE